MAVTHVMTTNLKQPLTPKQIRQLNCFVDLADSCDNATLKTRVNDDGNVFYTITSDRLQIIVEVNPAKLLKHAKAVVLTVWRVETTDNGTPSVDCVLYKETYYLNALMLVEQYLNS